MSGPMKLAGWVIVPILLGVLWLRVRARQNRSLPASEQKSSGSGPADKKVKKVYVGLRNLMLQGSRAKFRISPGSKPTQPYGVLMDWGIPAGSATVVAIADGTASVYLSSGGGFLGGGNSHESIRSAAKRTVEIADEVQPLMQPTTTYPIAQRGQVIFYVLTDAGVFTASASDDDLRSHRSPFYKLGDSAQTIVSEYRLIQQTK
jgi:hypothetical protein